jgi:hypothetical protein
MYKKLLISFGLLVVLTAGAVLINFNKPVEAAYLGSGLPEGTASQTLRYGASGWEASSILTNDGANLVSTGSITATEFLYSSDARLKDNITPLSGALNKVKALEGVSFNWKNNGQPEIGLVAQNVEGVAPELVVTGSDGFKAVKYGNVVALLIEAVKEQQAEIELLKAQVEELSK